MVNEPLEASQLLRARFTSRELILHQIGRAEVIRGSHRDLVNLRDAVANDARSSFATRQAIAVIDASLDRRSAA